MHILTVLALFLLLPTTAASQELGTALSAMVRISGTRGATPVRGSGFVIGLDRDKATIVTASHVIEGAQPIAVTFAVDPTESVPVGVVLGMDAGNPHGLAVFQVRGVPTGVTTLSFEVESRPSQGGELFLVGFPQMGLAPRTPRRVLSGRRGLLLLIDQGIGEGFSGGPVLQGGKVVGVVTDTDAQTTYAVSSVVARESLAGWVRCMPGEVRTENSVDFVRMCPGTFTMGSAENDPQADANEKPAHQVTLSEFWLGRTEITNEQYRRFRSGHPGEDSLPATGVSWADAEAACKYFGGRLPTEAEWEYAARAGSQGAWSFGDDEKMLGEFAWYNHTGDLLGGLHYTSRATRHIRHIPSPRKSPTPGVFTTCMGTCGSGWPTGTLPIRVDRKPTPPAPKQVRVVWRVEAPSPYWPLPCALHSGTAASRTSGAAASAFAVCSAPIVNFDLKPSEQPLLDPPGVF